MKENETSAKELVRMAQEWVQAHPRTIGECDSYLDGVWDVLEFLASWKFAEETYWQIHQTIFPSLIEGESS